MRGRLSDVCGSSEERGRPHDPVPGLLQGLLPLLPECPQEFVKYSSRAQQNTKSIQKALELTLSVPQRAADLAFIKNILDFPGDTLRLGRLIRHVSSLSPIHPQDLFQVWEGDQPVADRYVFLFKNKLMLTEKKDQGDTTTYRHLLTIRVAPPPRPQCLSA